MQVCTWVVADLAMVGTERAGEGLATSWLTGWAVVASGRGSAAAMLLCQEAGWGPGWAAAMMLCQEAGWGPGWAAVTLLMGWEAASR